MQIDTLINSIVWVIAQNLVTTVLMVPVVLALYRIFVHRPAVQNLLWALVLVKFVTPPVPYLSWTLPIAVVWNDSPPSANVSAESGHTLEPLVKNSASVPDVERDCLDMPYIDRREILQQDAQPLVGAVGNGWRE